jgi:ribosomal protein L40E
MTDTTCPSCDAPAPAGSHRCSRCGYRFLEGGGGRPGPRARPGRFVAGVAAVAAVALAAVLLTSGGSDHPSAAPEPVTSHLDILSRHPLGNAAVERRLEQRFLGVRKYDESAFVHCSRRIPQPAHSIRRCLVSYPGYPGAGTLKVVLLTTANGAEVISEP